MARNCPDCEVTLQTVSFGMKVGVNDAWSPYVKTERTSGGLLGTLGISEKNDVDAHLCPDCGRVLLYADV
ncbi:hypothetical protein OB920_01695 [Halobacteria archaeon HArc-gm2]|nr:hypothetical protein [Halobacteria archaeon HArc-gm2]